MINRVEFFRKLKLALFDRFSQLQVDGINAILDEIERQNVTNPRNIAYIFATAYHEGFDFNGKSTGKVQRLVPIIEGGPKAYLLSKKYYPYYGRGYVQLTWDFNYKKYSKLLGIDLIGNPDLALNVKTSAFVIVHGMMNGTFTGRKLDDYKTFVPMRAVVNGKDKANLIASHANAFLSALS